MRQKRKKSFMKPERTLIQLKFTNAVILWTFIENILEDYTADRKLVQKLLSGQNTSVHLWIWSASLHINYLLKYRKYLFNYIIIIFIYDSLKKIKFF